MFNSFGVSKHRTGCIVKKYMDALFMTSVCVFFHIHPQDETVILANPSSYKRQVDKSDFSYSST